VSHSGHIKIEMMYCICIINAVCVYIAVVRKMVMLVGEFLVMAGSFAVIFAILLCGIHPETDRACRRRIARESARRLERVRRLRK
jgi:hypothetical protein